MLKVAYRIERCIAKQSTDAGIVAFHMNTVCQGMDGFCRTEIITNLVFLAQSIGECNGGRSVSDGNAGHGMDADKRA